MKLCSQDQHSSRLIFAGAYLCLSLAALYAAQQSSSITSSEDRTRQLWNTKFQAKRPATAAPERRGVPQPQAGATTSSPSADAPEVLVGITVWRLRPATRSDDSAGTIAAGATREQWTPIRTEVGTPLAEGEKVRVSIESASSGYLYVIDREEHADGTLGEPYLIFPTLRTHGGDNEVTAGRVIEIPALGDSPPYFTLRMSRPDQRGEMLTVLVTSEPLREVSIGRDPLQLNSAQVERWSKQWSAKVERLESRSQIGQPYTRAEKEAATDRTRLLTHDEPLPQTLYRIEAAPGTPVLVDIPLRIRR